MSEQHLGGEQAVAGEVALVALGEAVLTHRCRGLELVDRRGPDLPAQAHHAGGHRPGGDQHHLDAPAVQRGDLVHPAADGRLVEAATVIGQQRTADLHHDSAGVFQRPSADYLLVAFHPFLGSPVKRHPAYGATPLQGAYSTSTS